MHLFFDENFSDKNPFLNQEESKHCIRVLRHTNGDHITVLNGNGSVYNAKITDANPKSCKLSIVDFKIEEKRIFNLHIAVAPTKNIDRFEWFLEKATEIGIDQITPIICDHSERKVIKPERLEKILVSATKQSLKSYKPILNPLTDFNSFIKQYNHSSINKFIAHCYDSPKNLLKKCYSQNSNAMVLIGPEGDFSENEVALAINNNYNAISLGKSRLRTETAALMACATMNLINLQD